MAFCMKCDRDCDLSESSRFEFQNESMTINAILCKKCVDEFLEWLLKEDED